MTSVSAVIPVHNGHEFVAHAVRSVLNQTAPALECIVVDDGSTDATWEILRAFGNEIRVMHQPQSGVSTARNRGAEAARGDLVAFLDHDDEWLPAKTERQLDTLGVGDTMIMCALQVIDAHGAAGEIKRLGPIDRLIEGMLMFDGTPVPSCSSSGMVRRDALLQMGGFDPALSMSADWDLLLRVLLTSRLAYVDEPLVRYRVHGGNMSRHVDLMERDMVYAFGKAFAGAGLPASLRARRKNAYGRLYRMLAGSYAGVGERRRAVAAGLKAVRHDPGSVPEIILSSYRSS
jgi:glycosyltransferase involved in cell wall biosynthesis